ncbi:MAG: NAD-dependent epimerase/dehydratase family protein [Pedosphaera sp.]|nr:NAD-dependent epimerase/dehydratase family protein [Pedosphaera sp.]
MQQDSSTLPERVQDETELDDLLTRPSPRLIESIKGIPKRLLILGAGGKMGPTLAVLAKRAATLAGVEVEVVAASRFSDARSRQWLESHEVNTCVTDLLDRRSLENLPDSTHIIYLVGLKFGTSDNPSLTWAANTLAPAHVAERFPKARIVALSTGNVYPFVPVDSGGATEDHALTPVGEYPNAAVARERIFDYFSRENGTRIALLRLNYAVELRYGVLLDIAQRVWAGQPVDLAASRFNSIWQGDANDMILRAFPLTSSPASSWNLTGPCLRVREIAFQFGEILGRAPVFTGEESNTALLSNPQRLYSHLGPPSTPLGDILRWTAHWVQSGGRCLNKPTHFEVRDGQY